jgi:hypothetical protein
VADWSPVDLLPGLWVGLLGALLASALRRWYDPVPARVLAVCALALLILFGPVLFGGGLLLPLDNLRGQVPFQRLPPTAPHGNILQGDLIELVTPSLAAVREALSEGRWPLWNRRAGAGMPLLADPQAQVFQPLVLLGYPLPLLRAAGVVAALRVLLALVFGFLWMRRQGLGEAPALAGALAFGLGGFLLLWLGWPMASSAALLPLVLYAVSRCDDPGGRRDALLLMLAAFALLLGGHSETILYALGMAALFLLDRVRLRRPGRRWELARRAAVAMAVAGMVAAPVLLPAVEYVSKTMRAARMVRPSPKAVGAPAGTRAAQSYLPLAAPNAFGNSRFVDYWGLTNTNEDASGFVGTATLLAALLSVWARRRFPAERLALGIAGVCLLLMAPWLPASHRLLLPLSLCLAYLGACTLERFQRGEIRRAPLLIVAAGLGMILAWGYLAHPDPADPARLAVFRFGWLRWQLRFLALAALLLAVAVSWQRRGRSLAVAGVAAAIAAELLLLHGPANPPMPQRLALPRNGPLLFLQIKLGQSPRRGPGYRMAALGRDFPPNLATLYGLADARIYNPMAPQAYVDRIAPVLAGWWGEVPEFGAPGHPLYERLGVRYLLAAPDARLPPPLEPVFASEDGSVWEVPEPKPRLFIDANRPAGRVMIPRFEDAWITAEVRLRRPQWLGTILYQDGGWHALVNGRPHPSEVDQGVFLTAELPRGPNRLDLLYRPAGFLWGCALAAIGLATGAALLMPAPRARTLTPRPPLPSPPTLPHRERGRKAKTCQNPAKRILGGRHVCWKISGSRSAPECHRDGENSLGEAEEPPASGAEVPATVSGRTLRRRLLLPRSAGDRGSGWRDPLGRAADGARRGAGRLPARPELYRGPFHQRGDPQRP